MTQRLLIVGAGLTGSLTANALKKLWPDAKISVWDKARGVGGRMTTSRSPHDEACIADLGAQYITTTTDQLEHHADVYQDLFKSQVIVPAKFQIINMKTFSQDTQHLVAPRGMSSVVKHLLKDLAEPVVFQQLVKQIDKFEDKTLVVTQNASEKFDIVILTIPVPQVLALDGIKQISDTNLFNEMSQVKYSSRFAVILFFDNFPPTDWTGKYLNDNIFRYVSVENVKRQQQDAPPAVVFHTSVQFGQTHLDKTLTQIQPILLSAIQELFPDWPKPKHIKVHKWRYSQVMEPFPGSPGAVVLQQDPLIIVGGDGFCESNVNGCITSSRAIVHLLQNKP